MAHLQIGSDGKAFHLNLMNRKSNECRHTYWLLFTIHFAMAQEVNGCACCNLEFDKTRQPVPSDIWLDLLYAMQMCKFILSKKPIIVVVDFNFVSNVCTQRARCVNFCCCCSIYIPELCIQNPEHDVKCQPSTEQRKMSQYSVEETLEESETERMTKTNIFLLRIISIVPHSLIRLSPFHRHILFFFSFHEPFIAIETIN